MKIYNIILLTLVAFVLTGCALDWQTLKAKISGKKAQEPEVYLSTPVQQEVSTMTLDEVEKELQQTPDVEVEKGLAEIDKEL